MSAKQYLSHIAGTLAAPLAKRWYPEATNSVTVFMLHGLFADDGERAPVCPSSKSLKRFQRAVTSLKQHVSIISLSEAVSRLEAGNVRGQHVVLTFDDSLKSAATYTAPMLADAGICGTFFLSTEIIETPGMYYWWHRVEFAAFYAAKSSINVTFANDDPLQVARDNLQPFKARLKALSGAERESVIAQYEDLAGVRLLDSEHPYPCAEVLDWDGVRTIADLGQEIGSHFHSHERVDTMDMQSIKRELATSRQILESSVDQPCRHACYPYGFYSDASVQAVRESGFSSATTCDHGWNTSPDDLFRLRRLPLHPSPARARFQVTGQSQAIDRARDLLFRRNRSQAPMR